MFQSANSLQVAGPVGRQQELARSLGTYKSMTVGNPYVAGKQGTGAAYVREQLDDFIVNLQEDFDEIKLMPKLYKQPCPGPVFKYDQILSWGHTSPSARFQQEIARPRPDQAVVRQVSEAVVYMGILGQVSFPAIMTDMIVDPEVQEVRSQTMQLLRSIETALYTSDSTLNPLAFDGFRTRILKQSPKTNIVNLHGKPLSLDAVDELLAVLRDRPNFGKPSDIHLNYKTHARFNREYILQGRYDFTQGGTKAINTAFDRVQTVLADVNVTGTSFITEGSRGIVDQYQLGQLAPANPVVSNVNVGAPASGSTSYFGAADAGSYYVFVQAVNADGTSQLVPVGSGAQNIAAGQVLTFNITAQPGAGVDSFLVLSTKMNETPVTDQGVIIDANAWEVGAVANQRSNMGAGTPIPFTFDNFKMPGTTEGYIFDLRQETMFWIEQMALGKTDLAITQSSKDFMLQMYGCPALRAPSRVAMFINIGS